MVLRNGLKALRGRRARTASGRAARRRRVHRGHQRAPAGGRRARRTRFTRVDLFAVNALVGQIFGEGGGGEAQPLGVPRRARSSGLGKKAGRRLFNDLSEHRRRRTRRRRIDRTFNYGKVPNEDPGRRDPRPRQLEARRDGGLVGPSPRARTPRWASNFLHRRRASARRPATRCSSRGPQIGYFYPGLTLEADISYPGVGRRAARPRPASPASILIGRGQDFAWSADLGRLRPDRHSTSRRCAAARRPSTATRASACKMGTVDAGTIKGEGRGEVPHDRARPGHGLREGRRQDAGRDLAQALELRPATSSASSRSATLTTGKMQRRPGRSSTRSRRSPFTFNVGYADDRDIAMYSAGRLPEAREGRRPASAHARHRQVRVERLPQDR